MKKYIKKLLVGTSLTLAGSAGLLILFILYPNNLFAKRVTYKTFNIYSPSPLKGDHSKILDRAIELVKASELNDSNYRYDIFLTDESLYKAISFKLFGPALARSQDNNVLLNVSADFEHNLLSGPANKRDLTRTIAHEMVHCLQVHRYGLSKFNPVSHPPLWKLEGYPEYIAHLDEISDTGYSFIAMIDRLRGLEKSGSEWVETRPGQLDPIIYFKGRVLVEYLMGVKGLSYDQLLDESVHEQKVYAELMRWRNLQTPTLD